MIPDLSWKLEIPSAHMCEDTGGAQAIAKGGWRPSFLENESESSVNSSYLVILDYKSQNFQCLVTQLIGH